jgi:hypothetical protein
MLTEMADESSAARAALDYLGQLQPDLRGAAIFNADGRLLACDGGEDAWGAAGSALLAAIDEVAEAAAKESHIATATGEVFMVSGGGRRLVAVSERFVLASLLSFDMRTVLRGLGAA